MLLPPPRKARKKLSADALLFLIRLAFEQFPDGRRNPTIQLADALMSALAMFALKDPSLLAFEERRNDENLLNLFNIGQIPSDTRMREMLDEVDPLQLRSVFNDVFRELQRGKGLEPFVFYKGCYLLSLDGTGYFSSTKVHCDSCQQKVNKQTGETTYYHQMLGAVLVHPDRKEVIPLAPEPIIKQDGTAKNDCERNAAKRLLDRIRQEHPRLPLIVVEDALASNGPHIRELLRHRMHFILGVKPGDHQSLFDQFIAGFESNRVTTISWDDKGTTCAVSFLNGVPLNDSNRDLLVNIFQYCEYDADGVQRKHFTWITDFTITEANAKILVRGGRSRWKVENETFNTLKNQGYHFEHNYGHGNHNLSTVFAMLMMLAFLVDQVQQICCSLFRAVLAKLRTKRAVWDHLRSNFRHFVFGSMEHLYKVILLDLAKVPAPQVDGLDSS